MAVIYFYLWMPWQLPYSSAKGARRSSMLTDFAGSGLLTRSLRMSFLMYVGSPVNGTRQMRLLVYMTLRRLELVVNRPASWPRMGSWVQVDPPLVPRIGTVLVVSGAVLVPLPRSPGRYALRLTLVWRRTPEVPVYIFAIATCNLGVPQQPPTAPPPHLLVLRR
jgi:hypothetical protein